MVYNTHHRLTNRGTAGVVSSLSNCQDGIDTHTVHQICVSAGVGEPGQTVNLVPLGKHSRFDSVDTHQLCCN